MDRFWSKVKIGELNNCWNYTGALNKDGYGVFWYQGKSIPAHRYSHKIVNNLFTDNLMVCHKCDNRKCVNPLHLFAASQSGNMIDCVNKKRHYQSRKTHCLKGHPLSGSNLIFERNGKSRRCRECKNSRRRLSIK